MFPICLVFLSASNFICAFSPIWTSIVKLQRNDSMSSLPLHAGGKASTTEYGRTFAYDLEETMRRRYDPTGHGRRESEKPWLYTTKNLLKRESLRFVPSLLEWLNIIWEVADADRSGTMDREEYLAMHKHMCIAQGHCDKLGERCLLRFVIAPNPIYIIWSEPCLNKILYSKAAIVSN